MMVIAVTKTMNKTTFALLCLVVLISFDKVVMSRASEFGGKIDCQGKCPYRCSKASRHKMCIRACNTCCDRCNCVPPGTYGNQDVCPCYANMTTHGGRRKCP